MVGLVPTIQPSSGGEPKRGMDPRDKPEDDIERRLRPGTKLAGRFVLPSPQAVGNLLLSVARSEFVILGFAPPCHGRARLPLAKAEDPDHPSSGGEPRRGMDPRDKPENDTE